MVKELLHIFRTYFVTFRYIKKNESNFFFYLVFFFSILNFFLFFI